MYNEENPERKRTMAREFELKFAADETRQDAIARQFAGFQTIRMETTYIDTPDGALSRRKVTLRRRLENGVSVCTLKLPDGIYGRKEFEVQKDRLEDALEELCKLSGETELASLMAGGVVPLCGARFTRQAAQITLDHCTVELALDRGVLMGGGRELPLCEVEVELKSGSEDAAVAFAAQLAETYGLRAEPASKFARAKALAKGE